jgi:hypothetical protein
MRISWFAAVAGAMGLAWGASAQVMTTGPFTGDFDEGWEDFPFPEFVPQYVVFDGNAVVNAIGPGQGLHVTFSWGFFCTVFPFEGAKFMGGAGVNAEWVFNEPVKRFGGYFSTNADIPGAVANVYDEANNLMGTFSIGSPLCTWQWDGWEATGNTGIKRVEVIANNIFGCHIMHDGNQMELMDDVSCYADCNGDGVVNIFDFLCFQGLVTTGNPAADCNGDGSVNIFDFLCFQGAVTQGC